MILFVTEMLLTALNAAHFLHALFFFINLLEQLAITVYFHLMEVIEVTACFVNECMYIVNEKSWELTSCLSQSNVYRVAIHL